MKARPLTIERVKSLMDYSPDSGLFVATSTLPRNTRRIGDVLGCMRSDGYVVIGIDGASYQAHRLAWFCAHGGVWPEGQIDHINGVRSDNRISNLRDVDGTTNIQNRRTANAGSEVPLLGVTRCNRRFRAVISVGGKTRHLSTHDTPEQAHAAYLQAKRAMHGGFVELGDLT